jgi:hypothetical protein
MTKLQAAMKDAAAKRAKENGEYFRVGSVFKSCMNCTQYDKYTERAISGFNVFRSYKPKNKGWTYKCFDCLATDGRCWENAWDIGQEPRILPKSDISPYQGERGVKIYTQGQFKKEMRELHFPRETAAKHSRLSKRELKIMALEKQIAELSAMLGGGK